MTHIINLSHERNKRLLRQALLMKPTDVVMGVCNAETKE